MPKPITRPGGVGSSTTTSAASNFFQKFAQDTLPAAAANIQRHHTANIGSSGPGATSNKIEENSFTKKLRDNREVYRMQ